MDTPTPDDIASDVQQRSDTQLKRGLASRHMQMIAIGGAIGTGLFLASGATVANAGPGGASGAPLPPRASPGPAASDWALPGGAAE